MSYTVVLIIMWAAVILAIFFGLWGVLNFISGIIHFTSPELVCSNCGKKLTDKVEKCPKCKVKVK